MEEYGEIKPLFDRCFIELIPPERMVGSIIIPETVQGEDILSGRIVAIGDGIKTEKGLIPTTLNIGDVVIFHKFAGWETMEGLYQIRESDVMARKT